MISNLIKNTFDRITVHLPHHEGVTTQQVKDEIKKAVGDVWAVQLNFKDIIVNNPITTNKLFSSCFLE